MKASYTSSLSSPYPTGGPYVFKKVAYNNYPQFYDKSQSLEFYPGGPLKGGRFLCYKRMLSYKPFGYYIGDRFGMLSQVSTADGLSIMTQSII
jgi:hypothetical protein